MTPCDPSDDAAVQHAQRVARTFGLPFAHSPPSVDRARGRRPKDAASPSIYLRAGGRAAGLECVDAQGLLGRPIAVDLAASAGARMKGKPGHRGPPLLLQACGLKPARAPGPERDAKPVMLVVDCTAGLGRDAAVLAKSARAHRHAMVVTVERNPVVAALLTDGVRRALQPHCEHDLRRFDGLPVVTDVPALAATLSRWRTPSPDSLLNCEDDGGAATSGSLAEVTSLAEACLHHQVPLPVFGDASDVLHAMRRNGVLVDVVVLDPMFSASSGTRGGGTRRSAKPKRELQYLSAVVGGDDDVSGSAELDSLIATALQHGGAQRVVVKRLAKAATTRVGSNGGREPNAQVAGKAVRFDVFDAHGG